MSEINKPNIRRNTTLDGIKLIASFAVVFIHFNFYGNLGIYVDALARFAVPLFFISSGYFCYKNDTQKVKKKILHIVWLFIFATILYHITNIATMLLQKEFAEINLYFVEMFSLKNIVRVLLLNDAHSSSHLWFLLALIYSYVLQYFVVKFKISEKLQFVFAAAAICLHLFLGEILGIFSVTVPIEIVRNFLLMGYPFFCFGLLARKYETKLVECKNAILFSLIYIGVAETLLSRYLFAKNELYIGSLLVVFSLVVFALKYPDMNYHKSVLLLCSCSTNIYIFHRLVGSIISKGLKLCGFDIASSALLTNMLTISVCIFTTVLALIILKIEAKVKSKLKKI